MSIKIKKINRVFLLILLSVSMVLSTIRPVKATASAGVLGLGTTASVAAISEALAATGAFAGAAAAAPYVLAAVAVGTAGYMVYDNFDEVAAVASWMGTQTISGIESVYDYTTEKIGLTWDTMQNIVAALVTIPPTLELAGKAFDTLLDPSVFGMAAGTLYTAFSVPGFSETFYMPTDVVNPSSLPVINYSKAKVKTEYVIPAEFERESFIRYKATIPLASPYSFSGVATIYTAVAGQLQEFDRGLHLLTSRGLVAAFNYSSIIVHTAERAFGELEDYYKALENEDAWLAALLAGLGLALSGSGDIAVEVPGQSIPVDTPETNLDKDAEDAKNALGLAGLLGLVNGLFDKNRDLTQIGIKEGTDVKKGTTDLTAEQAITKEKTIMDKFLLSLIPAAFVNTYESFQELRHAKENPPVIKINLNTMFDAGVHKVSPNIKSPFESGETILYDFNSLNTYRIANVPLIFYFKSIVGFGFMFRTLFYIWRKFTGGDL